MVNRAELPWNLGQMKSAAAVVNASMHALLRFDVQSATSTYHLTTSII